MQYLHHCGWRADAGTPLRQQVFTMPSNTVA
jgi:hypothetical protein